MKYQNKKGFVLLETLIVTIFTLIIFTVLYTSVVPLLGRYDTLSYYNDLDTTYDLYYIRNMLFNDSNYSTIDNNDYKKLSCSDLDNKTYCYNLFAAMGINDNSELIFVNMNTGLNNLKNDSLVSDDIKDYVTRINETGCILILQNNSYISYLNIDEYDISGPICTITLSNNNSTSGVTTSVTCQDADSGCASDNPTGDTNLKSSKTYTLYDNAGNSNTCTVTVSAQKQESTCSKATWGNSSTTTVSSCSEQSESSANANLWNYVISCSSASHSYSGSCTCVYGGSTLSTPGCNQVVYNAGGCSTYCKNLTGYNSGSGTCSRNTSYTKTTKSRTGCSTWSSWSNNSSCSSKTYKRKCQTIYRGSV